MLATAKSDGKSFKNPKKVSSFLVSIPSSNAHTERIFSLMNAAWRDERNRLDIETVTAELQVSTNFHEDCSQIFECLLKNKELLPEARKKLNIKDLCMYLQETET